MLSSNYSAQPALHRSLCTRPDLLRPLEASDLTSLLPDGHFLQLHLGAFFRVISKATTDGVVHRKTGLSLCYQRSLYGFSKGQRGHLTTRAVSACSRAVRIHDSGRRRPLFRRHSVKMALHGAVETRFHKLPNFHQDGVAPWSDGGGISKDTYFCQGKGLLPRAPAWICQSFRPCALSFLLSWYLHHRGLGQDHRGGWVQSGQE